MHCQEAARHGCRVHRRARETGRMESLARQEATNGPLPEHATARALATGAAIGVFLAAGNVYTGLKIAFMDGGAIVAAVLGYSLFALLRPRRGYTRHENNVTQATAAAAGVMGAVAGLVGPIPAMELLGIAVMPGVIVVWGLALGGLGIAVAVLLAGRLIHREQLPFPTGTATAEVITTAFRGPGTARRSTRILVIALGSSMLVTAVRDLGEIVPSAWLVPAQLGAVSLASLGVGVGASPLLMATGVLMGIRGGLSFVAGSVVAWLVLAPKLLAWEAVAKPEFISMVAWLVWPSVAMMVASATTSLALQWRGFGRALADLVRMVRRSRDDAPSRIGSWAVWGVATAMAVVTVVAVAVFEIHVVLVLALVPIGVVLTAVCARAAGETDMAPVGSVGAIAQIGFGVGGPQTSLAAGSVASGMSSHGATLLWSLRTGKLLGTRPGALIVAQCVGTVVGVVVAVPAYAAIVSAHPLGSEQMPAPGALMWKTTALAVGSGSAALPPHAGIAVLVAAGFGAWLTWASSRDTAWARWCPSPIAMGTGFVMPAYFGGAIAVGVGVFAVLSRVAPEFCQRGLTTAAAGAMAGESLMGVGVAAAIAVGLWG
ncbi:MAG: peptide transporter [Myxococcales bacterium FL481]|nr:MAG: peptide transporter [Myxococcales bacterium FL481]